MVFAVFTDSYSKCSEGKGVNISVTDASLLFGAELLTPNKNHWGQATVSIFIFTNPPFFVFFFSSSFSIDPLKSMPFLCKTTKQATTAAMALGTWPFY